MAPKTNVCGGQRQILRELELYTWCEKFLAEERSVLQQRHKLMLETLAASLVNSECREAHGADTKVVDKQSLIEKNLDLADIRFQQKPSSSGGCPSTNETPPICKQNPSYTPLVKPDLEMVVPEEALAAVTFGAGRAKRKKSQLRNTLEKPETRVTPVWYPSNFVNSAQFELFFASLIILSAVAMAVECEYHGLDTGFMLGYKNFNLPAKDVWPEAMGIFGIIEIIFGVFFTAEVVLKILGQRIRYLYSAWNYFDMCLVIFWLMDTASKNMPVDGSLLRLVRLARLLRLLRLARALQGFDSLVVMTTALQGSISALFWVAILLFIVQMMFALLLNQVLLYFVDDQSQELKDRKEVFQYFGTFSRSMLTMFELTLSNWVPCARMLQENVSGLFVIFSILHKISLGFACVGVINGVFMQETFKVAQSDDAMLMRGAENKIKLHTRKMTEFVIFADSMGDGDGKVCFEEWGECLKNEAVHHWFAGQGLNLADAARVFELLECDGDGKLSVEEIVNGVHRLQGPAKSLDLAVLSNELYKRTEGQVQNALECILGQLQTLHARIDEAKALPGRCGSNCESSSGNAGVAKYSRLTGQREHSRADSPPPEAAGIQHMFPFQSCNYRAIVDE